MRAIALVVLSSLALVACSSSSATPDSGSGKPGSSGAAAGGGGGAKVVTIAKLGLKGTAAGETEDPMIGSGDPIMVMAAGFTLSVTEAKATDPKTVKDEEGISKTFDATNFKSETLPDGWAVTYQNKGGELGPNYFVSVRREIGGKAYLCETMQSNTNQQNAAMAFCKSLSK